MNNRWCYDVEVFPNFFCVSFVKIDTKDIRSFIIWEYKNDIKKLKEFMSQNLFLVGFNSLSYDMCILRFILSYRGNNLNKDLFNLSKKLVSDSFRDDETVISLRYPRYHEENIVQMDLMAMMGFLRTGVGLKQCSINLKWHRIQDLPLAYNHIVAENEVDEIIDYNINDTLITLELYNNKAVTQARELREGIALEYGEGMLSAADSKIANIMLEKMYEKATGISKKEFKEFRTHREWVEFANVIFKEIHFKSPELSKLLDDLKKIVVRDTNKFKFEKQLTFSGNTYNLGVGGLHTDEKPHAYRATENTKILTMDVASFYPSIMIEYGVKPEHLTNDFIKILNKVKKERIVAKRTGDKTKAESYKIVVNATFGKLGFNNYWLYDPLAMLKVTVNGQLFLLMLVEAMEMNGIKVISANTDGIELEITNEQEELALSLAKMWQQNTRFELEFGYYSKYIKRDVNNYVALGSDGKIKMKGAFLQDIDLKKGYKHPIVPRAVNNYFLYGTAVEDTIMSCKDIFDFCMSQKIGKQFDMEQVKLSAVDVTSIPAYSDMLKKQFLQSEGWSEYNTEYSYWSRKDKTGDSTTAYSLHEAFEIVWVEKELGQRKLEKIELQKTNRFFISTKGAVLQKRNKKTQGTIGLMVGQPVTILNDYDPSVPFENYDINFKWYIKQAKDMIEEIEPTTIQLDFLNGANLSATVTSLSEETSTKLAQTKKPTKAKDILEADKSKRKFPVSRSYLLVTSVNTLHTPKIMVYSLSNGQNASLKMNKKLFDGRSVAVGDLINVTRFSKKPKVYKQGDDWVEVPNEVVYYIESFEVVKDIEKFIKQNRL